MVNLLDALNTPISGGATTIGDPDDAGLSAFLAVAVDNAQVAAAQAKMLDPAGTYIVAPDPEHTPIVKVKRDDKGRFSISYFAIGAMKDGTRGRVSAYLSPELQERFNEGSGRMELDYKSKRWVEAVAAYKIAKGEGPASNQDMIDFLTTANLSFRIVQMGVATKNNPDPTGEPGTLVVAIQPVRG